MSFIVSFVGAVAIVTGLTAVARPSFLIQLVEHWSGPMRYWIAIVVRVVLGVILIFIAPQCRLPMVVRIIGGVAIVAAAVILMAGSQRLDSFITWWLKSTALIRVSAVFAIAFGSLMVYAGA